jgi:hypothetical protein
MVAHLEVLASTENRHEKLIEGNTPKKWNYILSFL